MEITEEERIRLRRAKNAEEYMVWKTEQAKLAYKRMERDEANRRAERAAEKAAYAIYAAECEQRISDFVRDKRVLEDYTTHVFHLHSCATGGGDWDVEPEYNAMVPGSVLSLADYEVLVAIQYGMGTSPVDDKLRAYLVDRAKSFCTNTAQEPEPCTYYIYVRF